MTVQTERERRPGKDDALIAQQATPATSNDEHGTADGLCCVFPRRQHTPSDFHRMIRPREEYRASRLREPGAGVDLPTRLPETVRIDQIQHAVACGFAPWEIAELVPAPVTDAERAAATARVTT